MENLFLSKVRVSVSGDWKYYHESSKKTIFKKLFVYILLTTKQPMPGNLPKKAFLFSEIYSRA